MKASARPTSDRQVGLLAALADDIGTQGCSGLWREFAALLFEVARVGDRVVVWDGTSAA